MESAAIQTEMGYQLMFSVLSPEAEPSASFYLVPELRFMRLLDEICPCGAEEMTSRCENFANRALEGGEIIHYHCRICPTAIVSRHCFMLPLKYDPRQTINGKFRGVSAIAGPFAAVTMSRGGRWRNFPTDLSTPSDATE